jgi:hypothetical protein
MGRVFLFGAYKYPRELNWLIGVLLMVMAMGEGFTGYLLPWDQTAYWATVVGINLNASAPIAGPFIADILRGGTEIGPETLSRFYSIHMLLIPGGLATLIALHLYLVIRLGITAPPWTRSAAGYEEPVQPEPTRRGLVEPRPRGNGNGNCLVGRRRLMPLQLPSSAARAQKMLRLMYRRGFRWKSAISESTRRTVARRSA